MKKLKVVSVVGTRPEIIRLSRVLNKLDVHCDHVLVHTGQNYDYELNQIFFDDLNVRKPDYFLNCAQESKSAANTIGNLITSVDAVLASELPDAMLVLGVTNSCLAVIPAKRWQISISLTVRLRGTIYCEKDCRPTRSSKPAVLCTRCYTIT